MDWNKGIQGRWSCHTRAVVRSWRKAGCRPARGFSWVRCAGHYGRGFRDVAHQATLVVEDQERGLRHRSCRMNVSI